MAYFSVNDLDIDPDEFLSACSNKELKETFELLTENYGYGEDDDKDESPRSEGQRNFNRYLRALKENWISVSKEDAQIIEVLGKKYGAT